MTTTEDYACRDVKLCTACVAGSPEQGVGGAGLPDEQLPVMDLVQAKGDITSMQQILILCSSLTLTVDIIVTFLR